MEHHGYSSWVYIPLHYSQYNTIFHMLHGAGIFTNICPNGITQFFVGRYTLLNINVHLKNEQILFEVYVKIRASMLRIWGVSRWKFCRKIGCSGRGHVKEKTTYLRSRLVVKHATLAAMLAVPERRVSGKSPPDRNTDSCTHWVRNNISSMTGQPTDLQGKSPLSHSMFRQWYLPVL